MIFNELFERYPCLESCKNDIRSAFEIFLNCYDAGGKILCCGNGGSAADCDHCVGELMKGFLKKRPLSDKEKELFHAQELEQEQLRQKYENGYDLEEVRVAAESMGMIPVEDAIHVRVELPAETVQIETLSWWDSRMLSLRQFFAA